MIEKFMAKYAEFYKKKQTISDLVGRRYAPALLYQAYLIYRTVDESTKPDIERDKKYQERNLSLIKTRLKIAEKGYDLEVDKLFLKHQLNQLVTQPIDKIPKAFRNIVGDGSKVVIERYVDDLYSNTELNNLNRRLALINMTNPGQLLKTKDPLILLIHELEDELKELREEEKILHQEHDDLKKVYLEALLKIKQNEIAPDANGTIRFTHGTVEGYSPKDAVYYHPITTLTGIIEKETGNYPFHVPDKLKQLHANKDFGRYTDPIHHDIPTCFLNTTNVTGGNSGSPTINAKGEQVGIIFDMTYESVIGDYYVIPELQRTISVDIRYVLFITDKYSGATHILKEIGLQ
jgi:hypothetical protein